MLRQCVSICILGYVFDRHFAFAFILVRIAMTFTTGWPSLWIVTVRTHRVPTQLPIFTHLRFLLTWSSRDPFEDPFQHTFSRSQSESFVSMYSESFSNLSSHQHTSRSHLQVSTIEHRDADLESSTLNSSLTLKLSPAWTSSESSEKTATWKTEAGLVGGKPQSGFEQIWGAAWFCPESW